MFPFLFGILLMACHPSKPGNENKVTPANQATSGTGQSVTDYFHLPGPINYNQQDYQLSWSSHPSENYYKHEYLPKGENMEKYKSMLLVELVLGNMTAQAVSKAKADDMEHRKATDPMANYQLSENKATGEFLLGLRMSQGNGDSTTIVEWNVYRYKDFNDGAGHKGVQLFGLSKRGYATDYQQFMNDIQTNGKKYVSELMGMPLPAIKLD